MLAPWLYGSTQVVTPLVALVVQPLASLAVRDRRNAKPPQLGDQYWITFCSRRSKLPPSLRVPVMPLSVRSPNGSTAIVETFHGVSQRPRRTLPQPPWSP